MLTLQQTADAQKLDDYVSTTSLSKVKTLEEKKEYYIEWIFSTNILFMPLFKLHRLLW